jgi:hypothetical protein
MKYEFRITKGNLENYHVKKLTAMVRMQMENSSVVNMERLGKEGATLFI